MDPLLKKLQLEMAIKEFKKMIPEHTELCSVVGESMFIYYTQLVKAGFTEEQAFQIVMDHGMDVGRMSWMDKTGGEEDEY